MCGISKRSRRNREAASKNSSEVLRMYPRAENEHFGWMQIGRTQIRTIVAGVEAGGLEE